MMSTGALDAGWMDGQVTDDPDAALLEGLTALLLRQRTQHSKLPQLSTAVPVCCAMTTLSLLPCSKVMDCWAQSSFVRMSH